MNKTKRSNLITYAIVIVAFVVMQTLSSTGSISSLLTGLLVPLCTYIILAVSLNLVVGILGELSLGHAGFMCVGAFSSAFFSKCMRDVIENSIVRFLLALLIGVIVAAIFGVIIGIPVLRLKGDYLAIVTLAFGEIIKNLVNVLYIGKDSKGFHFATKDVMALDMDPDGTVILNGPQGITGTPKDSTFLIGFILIMVTLFIVLNLINSRDGRAIMAIRDNRIAAESVGINITKYKLMAFVTSAALAGAAGALYGLNYSSLQAAKFNFNTSILVLVFVVLGGLGNIWGSLVAAAALTILPLMEPLLSAIGKDATLTGRTPLWRHIILVMTNSHTFTGYGFGMFWRDRQAVALLHTAFRSNSFMGTMTTGAHNVLLEYWLNVGLFGLASYFIALLASFRQMRKLERQNYIFCAAYMLWFMVMGWTERSMSTYEYQMVFLFLAMGVGSNKPRPVSRRRARLEKEAT